MSNGFLGHTLHRDHSGSVSSSLSPPLRVLCCVFVESLQVADTLSEPNGPSLPLKVSSALFLVKVHQIRRNDPSKTMLLNVSFIEGFQGEICCCCFLLEHIFPVFPHPGTLLWSICNCLWKNRRPVPWPLVFCVVQQCGLEHVCNQK